MKAKLDCIPCIFNQAFRAAQNATNDKSLIRKVLNEAGGKVKDIDLNLTPPEAALPIYRLIDKITGNSNPYGDIKKEHIRRALSLYPVMKKRVSLSKDPLKEAVKISIIGNAIDLGSTLNEIDIEKEFEDAEEKDFILRDFESFKQKLFREKEILYIADNAGETVFDRPLVELLSDMGKSVLYAVKEYPIINDATREDAELSGINTKIISTGSGIAGTVLQSCSEEFLNVFKRVRFIISKGQGNYETLSNVPAPIFFLFKVKCKPISIDTRFPIGIMLLLKSSSYTD